jgi:hypothetical protein
MVRGRWVIAAAGSAFVLGIVAGPILMAFGEGLWAIKYEKSSWLESQRLANTYMDAFPPPIWMSQVIPPRPEGCGYRDRVFFAGDPATGEIWSSAPWSSRQGYDDLAYSPVILAGFRFRELRTEAVQARTTAFGRAFLDACLKARLYRHLCAPSAQAIVDGAEDAIARSAATTRAAIETRFVRTRCVYLDGLRARAVGASFIPDRSRISTDDRFGY